MLLYAGALQSPSPCSFHGTFFFSFAGLAEINLQKVVPKFGTLIYCSYIWCMIDRQNSEKMKTLKNTPENNAKVAALKKVKEVQWVGEVTHDTIDKALTAINLFQGTNSGWYNPVAVRINGLQGIFMINEDGSLNFESRIIKVDNKKYKIEHLTNAGYNDFEDKYIELLEG